MPGIPDRVISLIESSGLNRGAFAHEIGLDDSKLSKSLSGTRRFSSLDLARIADRWDVTVDWLVTGEELPLAVAARTTSGDARTALDAAKRYVTMRSDLALLGWAQPWHPVAPDVTDGTYAEQGRALARLASSHMADSGRSVMELDLAAAVEEAFGADVAVIALEAGFDGLAAGSEDAKLIVLATSQIPARQRFTLAHELGHLLVGDDQGVHLDRDVYDKGQAKDPSEMRANSFASAFLMPEATLRERTGSGGLTESGFAALACDLKVSPSALAFRLQDLRLIDRSTCDRFKSLSAARAATIVDRGKEVAQWVALANTPRPPGLLVRDTYAAYEMGATTLRPYANLLGVDVDELRQSLESEQGAFGVS